MLRSLKAIHSIWRPDGKLFAFTPRSACRFDAPQYVLDIRIAVALRRDEQTGPGRDEHQDVLVVVRNRALPTVKETEPRNESVPVPEAANATRMLGVRIRSHRRETRE